MIVLNPREIERLEKALIFKDPIAIQSSINMINRMKDSATFKYYLENKKPVKKHK